MYHKNISNFGIDTNKYSWLPFSSWDEKQINYFHTHQFITPSFCKNIVFIKDRSNNNRFPSISTSSWILTEKNYIKNETDDDLNSNDIKAVISIKSTKKIYNRLEIFYKFFIDEQYFLLNVKELKEILDLMVSALFIVYKADTVEFYDLDKSSSIDSTISEDLIKLSIPKEVFSISKDYSLKPSTLYSLTPNSWKEFRKDDEKRLFYLNNINIYDIGKKNKKNKKR